MNRAARNYGLKGCEDAFFMCSDSCLGVTIEKRVLVTVKPIISCSPVDREEGI